ncbi:hypothetical protein DRZ77_02410 [Candidatus Woesearchaeota archaeon]|nr:hypothetical protein [Candidatus Woesearchaeota archaeon]RLE40382.1 MAG: hypothetical protein DRZ77_02410 [Candidatus Woesearchaeota archaeon]
MKSKIAPLPGSFMLTALVGLLLSIFFVWPLSATWGFTFTIFFAIMLVAAMISMTKAPSY